jgi:hypothetical protein
MNASNRYFNPSYLNQSTTTKQATPYYDPFNINGLILNILADRTLSRGASDVLAALVRLSGIKGYCYPSIQYLSVTINKGRTQVKVYLKELVTKKRLRIVSYVGRVSAYQLLDMLSKKGGPGRFFAHRKEYKNKENVTEKPNVILTFPAQNNPVAHSAREQVVGTKTAPTLAVDNNIITASIPPSDSNAVTTAPKTNSPSTVFDMSLVKEILDITGDKKSLGCFIKIVKRSPPNIICAALSSLKIAMSECYISKPGAYFVQVVKNYYPDIFNAPQTLPERPSTSYERITAPVKEVSTPIDWQINMEGIKRLQSMLVSTRRYDV